MTLKKILSDMHQYILPSHDRPIYVLYRRHRANPPLFSSHLRGTSVLFMSHTTRKADEPGLIE